MLRPDFVVKFICIQVYSRKQMWMNGASEHERVKEINPYLLIYFHHSWQLIILQKLFETLQNLESKYNKNSNKIIESLNQIPVEKFDELQAKCYLKSIVIERFLKRND